MDNWFSFFFRHHWLLMFSIWDLNLQWYHGWLFYKCWLLETGYDCNQEWAIRWLVGWDAAVEGDEHGDMTKNLWHNAFALESLGMRANKVRNESCQGCEGYDLEGFLQAMTFQKCKLLLYVPGQILYPQHRNVELPQDSLKVRYVDWTKG